MEYDWCPYTKQTSGHTDRHTQRENWRTQGERLVKIKAEVWMVPKSQEMPEITSSPSQGRKEAWTDSPLQPSEGTSTAETLIPSLQGYKTISVQFGVPFCGSPRKRIFSAADDFHCEPPFGSWMIKVCQMFLALITSTPEGNRGCNYFPIPRGPAGVKTVERCCFSEIKCLLHVRNGNWPWVLQSGWWHEVINQAFTLAFSNMLRDLRW